MIFDAFARIVESELPNLFDLFNQASIFTFDDTDFTSANDKELVNKLKEIFFLPFPVLAVEMKDYSCILWDVFPLNSGIPKKSGFIFLSDR